MKNAKTIVPKPLNEPILSYGPGTKERIALKNRIKELKSQKIEIPLIIGGKEVKTGNLAKIRVPHDHQHLLADPRPEQTRYDSQEERVSERAS